MESIWLQSKILSNAFEEYCHGVQAVYCETEDLLRKHDQPPGFEVALAQLPQESLQFRRNVFSTLFQSIYHLLNVTPPKRLLYGQINHLFRIWVTSADNLLDNEDKLVLPIQLPNHSHIMHQVIAVMAADRVLCRMLHKAVSERIISTTQSVALGDETLRVLLGSAAQEASEEMGITHRPNPEYVLNNIHHLKTGLLFSVPFMCIDSIEHDIEQKKLSRCKTAFEQFGLGCQLLDDIRDLAKDLIEKRHNYVLSKIYYENRTGDIAVLSNLGEGIDINAKIHSHIHDVVNQTAEKAFDLLITSLTELMDVGLDIATSNIPLMAKSMFHVLDVGELAR